MISRPSYTVNKNSRGAGEGAAWGERSESDYFPRGEEVAQRLLFPGVFKFVQNFNTLIILLTSGFLPLVQVKIQGSYEWSRSSNN